MKVNEDTLAAVCDALGINEPVTIRAGNDAEALGADAWYTGRNGTHQIWVRADLLTGCRWAVQELVLHELTHAAQAERMGGWEVLRAAHGAQLRAAGLWPPPSPVTREYVYAYNASPLEAEANATQYRADEFDLIITT